MAFRIACRSDPVPESLVLTTSNVPPVTPALSENCDVFPLVSVAVAVTVVPAVRVKLIVQFPLPLAVVLPRYVRPSPDPPASGTPVEKTSTVALTVDVPVTTVVVAVVITGGGTLWFEVPFSLIPSPVLSCSEFCVMVLRIAPASPKTSTPYWSELPPASPL